MRFICVNRNACFAFAIFFLWVVLCVFSFWWFQFRHLGAFVDQHAEFDGQYFAQKLDYAPQFGSSSVVVAHILDMNCPCTRFAKPHIELLEQRFEKQAKFILWQELPDSIRSTAVIPASPAVAIWNAEGELAYYGPYSSGSFCGRGDDLVANTLAELAKGNDYQWINQDAVGCFCPWNLAS